MYQAKVAVKTGSIITFCCSCINIS